MESCPEMLGLLDCCHSHVAGAGNTYSGVSLHLQDLDAFCNCGAGVVNDIDHGLRALRLVCACGGLVVMVSARTLSWIMLAVSPSRDHLVVSPSVGQ